MTGSYINAVEWTLSGFLTFSITGSTPELCNRKSWEFNKGVKVFLTAFLSLTGFGPLSRRLGLVHKLQIVGVGMQHIAYCLGFRALGFWPPAPCHRNIANLVNNTDTSAMSVIQYAVGILKAPLQWEGTVGS